MQQLSLLRTGMHEKEDKKQIEKVSVPLHVCEGDDEHVLAVRRAQQQLFGVADIQLGAQAPQRHDDDE